MTIEEEKKFLENGKYYKELPFYLHGKVISYDETTKMYQISVYSNSNAMNTSYTIEGYAFEEDLILDNTDSRNWVITTALTEEGYLEKATNADLDSRIGNAGNGNFTKYARDCKIWTAAEPGNQNFKNGESWCACFVDWCFIKTFDTTTARNLLWLGEVEGGRDWSIYTPYISDVFKSANAWHNTKENGNIYIPQVGDLVFFYVNKLKRIGHVGIVKEYNNGILTTIEGNTTGRNDTLDNEDVTADASKQGVYVKTYRINKQTGYLMDSSSSVQIWGYGTPDWNAIN